MLNIAHFMQTKVANILGVAGADVPISEIKKYLKPHLVS